MNQEAKPVVRTVPFLIVACFFGAVLRFATLESADLLDPTETRYAAIAQEMVENQNYLTPKIPMEDGAEAYLGKPPLHFWQTAFSFSLLGQSEWTARLPSFLGFLLAAGFTCAFATRFFNREVGLLSALVLLSSALMFVFSGASVVDMTLTTWITLAIVSFAFFADSANERSGRYWGWLFFLSLGLGFLTKGPVAIAVAGLPLAVWIVRTSSYDILKKLPWVSGGILFLSVVLPWFILAERANPGFIKYFFINENLGRYVLKNYGDRYGSGHKHFFGMSWLMLAGAFLPWTILLGIAACKAGRKGLREVFSVETRWVSFALYWALSAAVFFTFVRQLHIGYIIPCLPALSVLFAFVVHRMGALGYAGFLRRLFGGAVFLFVGLGVVALPVGLLLKLDLSVQWTAMLPLMVLLTLPFAPVRGIKTAVGSAGTLAVATISLYGVVLQSATPFTNGASSTESILEYVAANTNEAEPEVALVADKAYSAYLYARGLGGDPGKHFKIYRAKVEELDTDQPDNLIVEQKNVRKFEGSFHLVKVIGKWAWMRPTRPVKVALQGPSQNL